MSEPTDILLKLKTEGDTSGAEAVEESLGKVKDASKELADDTESAAQEEQAVNDREMNFRSRALAVAQVGEAMQKYGAAAKEVVGNLEGVSDEAKNLVNQVADATEEIGGLLSAVGQGFAAGGPVGAILAGTAAGVFKFISAYSEAGAAIEKADQASQRALESVKRYQDFKGKFEFADQLEKANDLLDEQLKKMVRNERVRASGAKLGAAVGADDDQQAVASGRMTAGEASGRAATRDATEQTAQIQASVDLAAAAQRKLQTDADLLAANANKLADDDAEKGKLLDKMREKQAAANEALDDFAVLQTEANNQIAALKIAAQNAVKEGGEADQTKMAQALQAEVSRIIESQGGQASAALQQVATVMQGLLSDQKLSADETTRFANAMQLFRQSTEAGTQATQATIQGMISVQQNSTNVMQQLGSQIDALNQKVSSLSGH